MNLHPGAAMMRTLLLCLAVLATALAGCSDGPSPDDGTDDPGSDGDGTDTMSLQAPQWQVGDWWELAYTGGGGATYIVTEDAGDAWIVDVDDPDVAFSEAVFDPTPFTGPIQKSDLSGDEDGASVQLLAFPLHDGKIWSTEWDGHTWDIVADRSGETTFVMTATSPTSGETRTYTYANETRWIAAIEATDANGTVLWGAQVSGSGSDYSGEYVRWTVHATVESDTGPGGYSGGTFDVPEGAELWYFVHAVCSPEGVEGDQGAGIIEFGLDGETDPAFNQQQVCPEPLVTTGTLEGAGTWRYNVASAGPQVDLLFIPRTLQALTL